MKPRRRTKVQSNTMQGGGRGPIASAALFWPLAQGKPAPHILSMMPVELLSVAIGVVLVILLAVVSMAGPPDPGG
ncbi:hypothetical protein ATE48_17725 [Candidatus Viadribacter manganicus]|uniref:Uncharacterized protein n=1 Tax=Candidatus Viadribacter manganicus TaxID=1759059 RepID=A0A1B1AM41_9PROT|nr:hypothetical protein ATE48_17725 [Candidatus Viadribacter manganicus]